MGRPGRTVGRQPIDRADPGASVCQRGAAECGTDLGDPGDRAVQRFELTEGAAVLSARSTSSCGWATGWSACSALAARRRTPDVLEQGGASCARMFTSLEVSGVKLKFYRLNSTSWAMPASAACSLRSNGPSFRKRC